MLLIYVTGSTIGMKNSLSMKKLAKLERGLSVYVECYTMQVYYSQVDRNIPPPLTIQTVRKPYMRIGI